MSAGTLLASRRICSSWARASCSARSRTPGSAAEGSRSDIAAHDRERPWGAARMNFENLGNAPDLGGQAEIVPCPPLVGGVAQQVGRVISHDQRHPLVTVHPPAQPAYRLVAAQQGLH